ncbi:kinase domain protein [Leptospira inadai serovar Lyme str. 10]|uniref:Kinase domain protein n=2 Tax=Leptospira inadai serovar Lyme TaxID=293084 RepID=V6HC67_9LEPT|nr:AAA family ATPase [Leptospira inadai]EQA36368.1 kinase domain protein [Leptospira inadai serovar Lyme str. 10]PNV75610.1 histidine kinase [Leptospira inadai serovar Lyme]
MISGYEIREEIHKGGNVSVFRGNNTETSDPVIIKIHTNEYPSIQDISKFKREYEIGAGIHSFGVIRYYGIEKYKNSFAIVMEDCGAISLNKIIKDLNLELSLKISIKIVEALGEIHKINVIHKDIKPSNIIVNLQTGSVKIIDFGIASKLTQENASLQSPEHLEGTLGYMSPEQTGRMNRSIDYRSDFYSLGATFYEMLTGELLFETTNSLELIHYHIAKIPVPPHERKNGRNIPENLSKVIMKLLAKNAEDRYQSVFGIKADLEKCLAELDGTVASDGSEFIPGKFDISERFQIPQKLYGREEELEKLLNSFEKVSFGEREMIFISGYSGIGKSSLVNEIHKPVLARRGYVIEGKYEQFKKDIPYSGFLNAFQSLIRQVLSADESTIESFRKELTKVLGINGRILSDVIPELELILGKLPPSPTLGPQETQNRFNLAIQNFVQVFARSTHPLTIFLDDLQWADSASLKLLEILETNPECKYLFIIGAYRDNEVDPLHPLLHVIGEIKKSGTSVESIALSPLDYDSLNLLISEALHCGIEKAKPLAELVASKTDRNPFFVNEFLKTLYKNNLLSLDVAAGSWIWDLEKIKERDITDNVVELMSQKIKDLPAETSRILQFGACIGNSFDLKTISIVRQLPGMRIIEDLFAAVECGLLLPLGNAYRYLAANNFSNSQDSDSQFSENLSDIRFKFLHDRVQQAAYDLIPESERPALHLKIGRHLLNDSNQDEIPERLIDIVGHLNAGIHLVDSERELSEIADLNFQAGVKAKDTVAYKSASYYFQVAMEILGESGWESRYEKALSIYSEAIETEYLNTDFDRMEELARIAVQKSRSTISAIHVFETRMRAKTAQSKYGEAIAVSSDVLRSLGVYIPTNAKKIDILTGLIKTKFSIGSKSISEMENLPEMKDSRKLAAMNLMMETCPAAYIAAPNLFPIIVFNMIRTSLKYGNSPVTAYAFCVYGLILISAVGDLQAGYEFGKMSLRMMEKFEAPGFKNRINMLYNTFIIHWKEHIAETKENLEEASRIAIQTGDLEYACYSAITYCNNSFLSGDALPFVLKKGNYYLELSKKFKQETAISIISIVLQFSEHLSQYKSLPEGFYGKTFQKENLLYLSETKNFSGLSFYYFMSSVLHYLSGSYEKALECSDLGAENIDAAAGLAWVPEYHFYRSMILLAMSESAPKSKKRKLIGKASESHKKLKKWTGFAPMNHLHKLYLMEAEQMKVLGNNSLASDLYEKAIQTASKNNYGNIIALSYERAAKFYLSDKKDLIGKVYLQKAHYFYTLWGALAKVKEIEELIPEAFPNSSDSFAPVSQAISSYSIGTATKEKSSRQLDFDSILKASQALSGEIVLERLLEKIMAIAIENAGAETGLLILDRNGNLEILARGSLKEKGTITDQESSRLTQNDTAPTAILEYVRRTGKTVVISDAIRDENFASIPYVIYNKPKSIISLPIRNQGKFLGMLYLENNLTTGAFTPERIDVLDILSSQAAISIENALLYSNLESKVKERTTQLKNVVDDLNKTNSNLEGTLKELHSLKQQQDGDYYLTSLLMTPLNGNEVTDDRVSVEFFLKQKKEFQFKQWTSEIGGDLCSAHTIILKGKKYTAFSNADAMGKSIQGAGGALVFGSVFEAMIQRVKLSAAAQDQFPERWLKNAFTELDKIFRSFDGSMYVSCIIGLIDNENGFLYCFNAEHPGIVLYKDRHASFIQDQPSMYKLGTFWNDGIFAVQTYQLSPGDSIFIGSDGKDDLMLHPEETQKRRMNENETLFLECVAEGKGELTAIREAILRKGDLTDDFSILHLNYKGSNETGNRIVSSQVESIIKSINSEPVGTVKYLSLVSELENAHVDNKTSIPIIKCLMKSNLRLKRHKEAADYAVMLSSLCPGNTKAIFVAAHCFKKVGNLERAIDMGERLRLRNLQDVSLLSLLAKLYGTVGNQAQAEILKEKVSQMNLQSSHDGIITAPDLPKNQILKSS